MSVCFFELILYFCCYLSVLTWPFPLVFFLISVMFVFFIFSLMWVGSFSTGLSSIFWFGQWVTIGLNTFICVEFFDSFSILFLSLVSCLDCFQFFRSLLMSVIFFSLMFSFYDIGQIGKLILF